MTASWTSGPTEGVVPRRVDDDCLRLVFDVPGPRAGPARTARGGRPLDKNYVTVSAAGRVWTG